MKFAVKFFFLVLSTFVVGAVLAAPASAHVLKVDGAIGATLHVDPADNPVAGETASFYFEIKDRDGKFAPEKCACVVHIENSMGGEVRKERLFAESAQAGLTTPLLRYTFQNGGVYTVVLEGSPKTPGEFQHFRTSYTVRVENQESSAHTERGASADRWLYVGLGFFVLVVCLLLAAQRKKKTGKVSLLVLLFGVLAAGNMVLYSGHYFETPRPAVLHHHVDGETGHADVGFNTVAPHLPATSVALFVPVLLPQWVLLSFVTPDFIYFPAPFQYTDRGPPTAPRV